MGVVVFGYCELLVSVLIEGVVVSNSVVYYTRYVWFCLLGCLQISVCLIASLVFSCLVVSVVCFCLLFVLVGWLWLFNCCLVLSGIFVTVWWVWFSCVFGGT